MWQQIWDKILMYGSYYLDKLSFLIQGDYYKTVFNRYYESYGFLIGIAIVGLLFLAGRGEEKKTGFFKVLPFVALINCCGVLMNFITLWVSKGAGPSAADSMSYYFELLMNSGYGLSYFEPINTAANLVSGFVTTLVVYSCYKESHFAAFMMGVAIFAISPLLNYQIFKYMGSADIIFLVIRTVLAGIVCLIISYRKNFFTAWIWYFGFHVFCNFIHFLLPELIDLIKGYSDGGLWEMVKYSAKEALPTLAELLVFGVVLVFSIIFERAVIKSKSAAAASV